MLRVSISLRISGENHAYLKARAYRHHRSMNGEISEIFNNLRLNEEKASEPAVESNSDASNSR